MTIYNIAGQKIGKPVERYITPGYHQITWDGKDQDGHRQASGIYFYQLQAGKDASVKKMIIVK